MASSSPMARFAPTAIGSKKSDRFFSKTTICIGSSEVLLSSATRLSILDSSSIGKNSLSGISARVMMSLSAPSPPVSPDPHAAAASMSPKAAQHRPVVFMRSLLVRGSRGRAGHPRVKVDAAASMLDPSCYENEDLAVKRDVNVP
ncbi:hypothetical protein BE20_33330 [Sorangium cellulosum]|nr:hypothetical protein BE20_33330 [Sorangium cellulosum]